MKRSHNKLHIILIFITLVLATFIAFEQVRQNDFIDFDDPGYVTDNPHVYGGITRKSVYWAFFTTKQTNWHPLTWLSHMLDCELFGLNPLGHHLTSLGLHMANTLLLFWILQIMTGAIWPSAFVVAVFALHPLHVESVAWVSERKDVLSSFFWMLSTAAYIKYTRRPSLGRYLPVIFSFSLGLMAKPMLVTLPFVLLLLDYWPLRRFEPIRHDGKRALPKIKLRKAGYQSLSVCQLIGEKIPLFFLAAISSTVTFIVARQSGGVMTTLENLSLSSRLANACVAYFNYIVKVFWPSNLAVLYPHPGDSLPTWQAIFALVILAAVTTCVIYMAREKRYFVVGWLWYLGMLVPVIGLVQVGLQANADRYTYLPSIGLSIIIAWGTAELTSKWRYRKIILGISSGLILATLLLCTRAQVRLWQNSFTLYKHTLEVTENNFVVHNSYGGLLIEKGLIEEGISHIREALRINPRFTKVQNNLAASYLMTGKIKEAFFCLNKILEFAPDYDEGINNLAWLYATQKNPGYRNPEKALQLALRACKLTKFNRPGYLDTLAAAYAAVGEFSSAIETAEKALQLLDASGQKNLIAEIQNRLLLYKANIPYRESSPW